MLVTGKMIMKMLTSTMATKQQQDRPDQHQHFGLQQLHRRDYILPLL